MSTDYYIVIGHDDFFGKKCLSRLLEAAVMNPDAIVVSPKTIAMRRTSHFVKKVGEFSPPRQVYLRDDFFRNFFAEHLGDSYIGLLKTSVFTKELYHSTLTKLRDSIYKDVFDKGGFNDHLVLLRAFAKGINSVLMCCPRAKYYKEARENSAGATQSLRSNVPFDALDYHEMVQIGYVNQLTGTQYLRLFNLRIFKTYILVFGKRILRFPSKLSLGNIPQFFRMFKRFIKWQFAWS